ncbi:MAG: hypothetical protein IKX40_04350 [Thermoguttaceae bacterium]|nr:hypothetical protein [Thermoguttaceae bacterium]
MLTEGQAVFLFHVFPAKSLTDYRSDDYPSLDIVWKIQDKDLGEITLTAPEPAPFSSDPSFRETLELVEQELMQVSIDNYV